MPGPRRQTNLRRGTPRTYDDATIDAEPAGDADREVPDLANLILASPFLGQFLADRPFSLVLAIGGLTIWAGLAVLAFAVVESD